MSRRYRDPDELHDAMMSGDRPELAQRVLGRDIRPTEKCDGCPHPPHLGLCTRRNGQTANPCPCLGTRMARPA